ncbi:MAG: sugar ABC transporter ATP-binding protein [Treponema sp.]|jgi:ABC-type sugar transport system ATPase subunit|nr:sugar ABC transporter ATP-binding protein [Treponema sp.]
MRGISKKFDAVVALREASLKVQAGEIMALLGANGSGKSTMVKALSGLVNPDGGTVIYEGREVRIRSSADSRRLSIATAYQDLSLVPAMSVVDNIVMGMEPKNAFGIINRTKAREFARSYMKKLGIECSPDALVQSLMVSTQSLIEIAKALASKPKLLILDEATASLHSDEVDTLFGILRELKREGVSVITVTHRMSEIYRICDRCTILRGGETVAAGAVKDMDLDTVVYHMTGRRPDLSGAGSPADRAVQDEGAAALLEVRDLTLTGKLKGVDLRAWPGEIVGIGGLDGQGQQEFLRSVLGDLKPEGGEVLLDGVRVKFRQPADGLKRRLGFISGDRNKESIFPIRPVAENIYAGAAAGKAAFSPLFPSEVFDFAGKAVERYHIVTGGLKHPASSLSGGNQQKLVVGRWMALTPKLLLLDDPTKGVDISTRAEIHRILKDCTAAGMCALYSSSDNEELLEISDRIYVFYEGRISACLRGDERREERLVAAMLGLTGGRETAGGQQPGVA